MSIHSKFKRWFDRVIDPDLCRSLDTWQMARVERMCKKAYMKGREDARPKVWDRHVRQDSSTRVDCPSCSAPVGHTKDCPHRKEVER